MENAAEADVAQWLHPDKIKDLQQRDARANVVDA
jgi:hypothetical protein